MRKSLLLVMMLSLLFIGCTNNKIVGTWVSVNNTPTDNVGVSSGMVTFLTINADGTFEQKTNIQIGVENKSTSDLITLLGTWEMKDENTFVMDAKTAKLFGETKENNKITEYVITRLDDDVLEMMTGGEILKYRRK